LTLGQSDTVRGSGVI